MSERLVDRIIRRQNWLDGLAEFIQKIDAVMFRALGAPGRALKNLLHGTWPLGHPLHPAVTDIPIGVWGTGVLLDYVSQIGHNLQPRAGDIAIYVATLFGLLAVASGVTDFGETFGHERRVAITHGLTMSLVMLLELISSAMRFWGSSSIHPTAVYLSTAGFVVALLGGYLGGDVVYGIGTAVNRNAFINGPDDFVAIGKSTDFPEGKLCKAQAGDMPLAVLRTTKGLFAISALCSHAGGPLEEGSLAETVVTCPWHNSKFDVCTGKVKGGPATFDQPVMTVREVDGRVEVKPAIPLH